MTYIRLDVKEYMLNICTKIATVASQFLNRLHPRIKMKIEGLKLELKTLDLIKRDFHPPVLVYYLKLNEKVKNT